MGFTVKSVPKGKTLGELLREFRRLDGRTLREASLATKLQYRHLTAFESDDYPSLPDTVYARRLLKTYVCYLGGDPNYFLSRFDAECGKCPCPVSLHTTLRRKQSLFLSDFHKWLRPVSAIFLAAVVLFYIGSQIHALRRPPDLMVLEPADNAATSEPVVVVRGKTEPGTEIFINHSKILPSPDGSFSSNVSLERGLNIIEIEGSRRHSRQASAYIRVVLEEKNASARVSLKEPIR